MSWGWIKAYLFITMSILLWWVIVGGAKMNENYCGTCAYYTGEECDLKECETYDDDEACDDYTEERE